MLNALKRRIARYMASRGYVQHLVKEGLAHDPEFMDRLRHQIRDELLRDSSFLGMASAVMEADPDRLRGLARTPQVFHFLLSELGRNPEALCLMLQRAPLRQELLAQGAFLRALAEDQKVMRALLRLMPADQALAVWQSMLAGEPGEGVPEGVGAKLAQNRVTAHRPAAGEAEPLHVLSLLLAGQDGLFAASLPRDDTRIGTALLADDRVRAAILATLAADPAAVAELVEHAMMQPAHGESVARRLQRVLEIVTGFPAFRLALRQDPALRDRLLALLQEAAESHGQTLKEVVAAR